MQQDLLHICEPQLPRRRVVKGLIAATLTLGIAGCASPGSPAAVNASPTATHARKVGSVLFTYEGHTDQVLATAWSPDSKRVASGSRDKTAQVWDALNGGHASTYRGHSNAVVALSWSPDGQSIASGSWDRTVQVWSAASGTSSLVYRGHTANLTTVAWSPAGKYLASGSDDTTVQVWEARSGTLAQNYRGHTEAVTIATWSPDGRYIASGSADKTVQIWEATTGKLLLTFRKHSGKITALTWSPDGKYIASGSVDKTVQVWEAANGNVLYTYAGYNVEEARQNPTKGVPPDTIYAVAWSHDGKRIVAVTQVYCGDDCGEVLIWDALTRGHFTFYPTPPMFTLALAPNDAYFVSAIGISQVQVTQAP